MTQLLTHCRARLLTAGAASLLLSLVTLSFPAVADSAQGATANAGPDMSALAADLKKKPNDRKVLKAIAMTNTPKAVEVLVKSTTSKPMEIANVLKYVSHPDAAPLLHPWIDHENRRLQSATLKALAAMRNPASAPILAAAIADPKNEKKQGALIETLGACAHVEADIAPILNALKDKRLARSATKAVKSIRAPALAPKLYFLLKSKDKGERRLGAETLGEIGASSSASVLLDVVAKDKDRGVRGTAMKALQNCASAKDVRRMLKMIKKDEKLSRETQFLHALISADRLAGHKNLLKVMKAKDKRSIAFKKSILNALQSQSTTRDDVLGLAAFKSTKDDQVLLAARGALGATRTPAARDALCKALHKPKAINHFKEKKYAQEQGHAADMLAKFSGDETIDCLIKGLSKIQVYKHGKSTAWENIARALRRITGEDFKDDQKAWKNWQKSGKGVDGAIASLAHKDTAVRILSAERLSAVKKGDQPKAGAALLNALGSEKNGAVVVAYAGAISRLKPDGRVIPLVEALNRITDVAALGALAAALDDAGDGRGTLKLIDIIASGKNGQKAADALSDITGQPAHHNVIVWRKWWVDNAERYHR